MKKREATFRFYEELNDFLPLEKKKTWFTYYFNKGTKIKDALSSLGIPCPKVDLILVNGKSVAFSYNLKDNEIVSVYPVFETLNISDVTHLRNRPLRRSRFIVDMHLMELGRLLSRFGFDTIMGCSKKEIVGISQTEKRIILTQDREILKYKNITRCYLVKSQNPKRQLTEILHNFDLYVNIKQREKR